MDNSADQTNLLANTERLIFTVIGKLELVKFDKEILRHQIFVGLMASLLERCHACIFLIQSDKLYDAEIILRSAIEHLVELQNVQADKNYHRHMEAAFLKGMRLALQQADNKNPFYSSLAEKLSTQDELEEISTKEATVKTLGGTVLTAQEKFKRIGATDEYESIYRSLSNQVHPTYSGIIKRHFDIDSETGDFRVRGFQQPQPQSLEVLIDSTVGLINVASEIIEEIGDNLPPSF